MFASSTIHSKTVEYVATYSQSSVESSGVLVRTAAHRTSHRVPQNTTIGEHLLHAWKSPVIETFCKLAGMAGNREAGARCSGTQARVSRRMQTGRHERQGKVVAWLVVIF